MPYFMQLWPEKFQNKTNGVTPRRWIRFCNPDLSKIITQWIGTEDWVLNTEKLAELRKVITLFNLLILIELKRNSHFPFLHVVQSLFAFLRMSSFASSIILLPLSHYK